MERLLPDPGINERNSRPDVREANSKRQRSVDEVFVGRVCARNRRIDVLTAQVFYYSRNDHPGFNKRMNAVSL